MDTTLCSRVFLPKGMNCAQRVERGLNTVSRTDSTVCICSLFHFFVPGTLPNVMEAGVCVKKLLTS